MGMSSDNVGLVFSLEGVSYGLGSLVVGYLCTKFSRTYVITIWFFLQSLGLFLAGPSLILSFPENLGLMIFGVAVIAFMNTGIFVPFLPEMSEAIVNRYEKQGKNSKQI